MQRINKAQILIGAIGLLIGALIYLVDRSPDQTYFVYSSPINISLFNIIPTLFGVFGDTLPACIHVFSFTLISAGLLSCQKRACIIICLSWFFIDCAFEFGQKFAIWFTPFVPNWFTGIPFLENTKSYFIHGTFDFLDVAAIALGTAAAYLILSVTMKRRYASS